MKNPAMTVDEFRSAYRIGLTRAYELIASGEIEARKVGRKTLVVTESVDAWFARQPAFVPASKLGRAA